MAGKHGEIKPERSDQDNRGEILLDIYEEENIEGKMEPEQRTLKSSRAGGGLKAPGQSRLSGRQMQ